MKLTRFVVLGATGSTKRILNGLVRHHAEVVGVFGLVREAATQVSGYVDMEDDCRTLGLPYFGFTRVNAPETVAQIATLAPDILFAVGFSQLVRGELLAVPSRAVVGFHPTRLPARRGRAPVAWLSYDRAGGAATFFVLGAGIDDGAILVQEPFEVDADDHAGDVERRIWLAIDKALDQWLPELLAGIWDPIPQDHARASYTGCRRPMDGLIDWIAPLAHTYARIRAASRPHPGAYTFARDRKLVVWRARPAARARHRGEPGRVLAVSAEEGLLVQAGEGQIWLEELAYADAPDEDVRLAIGERLGYVPQHEIAKLKEEVRALRQVLHDHGLEERR